MGMVAPEQRIASAYVIFCGEYGAVRRQAEERRVCRQRLYREAAWVVERLQGTRWQQEIAELRAQVRQLQESKVALQRRLDAAVVLDEEKQKEVACVGQAMGVSLPEIHALLQVLQGEKAPSVAKLGRWTQAAGARSAGLLEVLDELAREQVKQVAADEIYVKDPVLMVVEPESLCWLAGRLHEQAQGEAWAETLRPFPHLEQVTRDAGLALSKGVAVVNRERSEQGLPKVADQLDHFHALRGGQRGVQQAEKPFREALAVVEETEQKLAERRRRGQTLAGISAHGSRQWAQATEALQAWQEREQAWLRTKQALQLITPEGELNTRARAEAVLAETLPQLADADFGKTKRLLRQPQTLTYLDEVQRKLQALPVPAEVLDAAVRQEGLRRRPELLQGDGTQAATLRGVLLMCAVILSKAGEAGQLAAEGVRAIFRNTWRASSLVECINSVLRMQQARHRKMTQGLLNLKRLYWNCHSFRTGRRRGKSPYQRLGLPWPEGLRWWDVLKLTPEQLRHKLSATELAA
jgi:hypothetical protein